MGRSNLEPGPDGRVAPPLLLATLALALATAACGAKTGLLIPDADVDEDAGMDAGVDAAIDAGEDAGPDASDTGIDAPMCMPGEFDLVPRGSQAIFVIDRSGSMAGDIEGDDPGPGRPSRWMLLRTALSRALEGEIDLTVEIGAKFFPQPLDPDNPVTIDQACGNRTGLDFPPATGNVDRLIGIFSSTQPFGGTPMATALEEVRDFFATAVPGIPRFIILANDGGPNCNPEAGVPPMCPCTGEPSFCDPDSNAFAEYNCLDEERTISVIRELYDDLGVPTVVIGIDDPNRPDLVAVQDQMAIAGGRPLPDSEPRRYYSVRAPDDLDEALRDVADSISRCVFAVDPPPAADASVEIRIGGVTIPRDRSQEDGWDWLVPGRSQLGFFGSACERAAIIGDIDGVITCPDEP